MPLASSAEASKTLEFHQTCADLTSMGASIHDVCDYLILRLATAGSPLTNLKLQKLLFYSQAWNLAFGRGRLFEGKFQAWVHGPVNREIYDRFATTKSLYSEVTTGDILAPNPDMRIPLEDRQLIDSVIDTYARYSGTDLEVMTHQEQPWIEARGTLPTLARCETEIIEDTMRNYYASRLIKA